MFIVREPILIRKAKRPKWKKTRTYRRLERLSHTMSNAMKLNFITGIKRFKNRIDPEEVYQAWLSGDYGRVYSTIPWDKLWGDLSKWSDDTTKAVDSAATVSHSAMSAPIKDSLRWDVKNPFIRSYLKDSTGHLVKGIEKDTKNYIAQSVTRSFTDAATPRRVAEMIKPVIGLYPQQITALENYRTGLEINGATPKQIEQLSASYHERLLDYRANMIARTEIRRATNYGQLQVWKQGAEQGLISKELARKVWVVDGDPCDVCEPMDGVAIPLDDEWELDNGDSVDIPSDSHPNCFPPGHKVLTKSGMIPIEEVNIGDYVWTHKSRWRKVVNHFNNHFQGDLVSVTFHGGVIRCTPNHEFLTDNSWVAAGKLSQQSDILQVPIAEIFREQIHNEPSSTRKELKFIEVVLQLLRCIVESSMDFNRKFGFRDRDVDVELPESHQRPYFQFDPVAQEVEYYTLLAGKTTRLLDRLGSFLEGSLGYLSATSNHIRGLCNLRSKFWRSIYIPQLVLFGRGSLWYPQLTDDSIYHVPGKPKAFRYRENRLTALEPVLDGTHSVSIEDDLPHEILLTPNRIAIDELSKQPYSGTVYNLTVEEDHSYTVEGIVVHNCMCGMEIEYEPEEE